VVIKLKKKLFGTDRHKIHHRGSSRLAQQSFF